MAQGSGVDHLNIDGPPFPVKREKIRIHSWLRSYVQVYVGRGEGRVHEQKTINFNKK